MKKVLFISAILVALLFSGVSSASSNERERCITALKRYVNASHTMRVEDEYKDGNKYYIEFTTRIFVVTHKWNGRCVFRPDGVLMDSSIMRWGSYD